MGALVRADFEQTDEPCYADDTMNAMRVARRISGETIERWVRIVAPKVTYGTVTVGAVECYESGENVPGADYFMAALGASGFPIHRLLSAWMDDNLRDSVLATIARF